MGRFEELIATVEEHQRLVEENYARIRRLAEELREGLCDWLAASDGVCVRLVPPAGQFQPRAYGDEAFSVPPKGFRPLGPIAFGLAIRVSRGSDWMRLVLVARKTGDNFRLQIQGGEEHVFDLPLTDNQPEPLYNLIFDHAVGFFREGIDRYRDGAYSQREIGFDFSDDEVTASV